MVKSSDKRKRAGVIPYIVEDGIVKMLFMQHVENPDVGWQIAKGGVEKNETIREGAMREATEELGLFEPNCSATKSLGSFGGITLYIAEVMNLDMFGDPDPTETHATAWLTMEEFTETGRSSQKHIVKQAFATISDLIE